MMWPFLTYVLDHRLQEAGKSRADFARALSVEKSTITRMLDGTTAYSRVSADDAVTAAASLVGVKPIELWQEALGLWSKDGDGRALEKRRAVLATRRRGQQRVPRPQGA